MRWRVVEMAAAHVRSRNDWENAHGVRLIPVWGTDEPMLWDGGRKSARSPARHELLELRMLGLIEPTQE